MPARGRATACRRAADGELFLKSKCVTNTTVNRNNTMCQDRIIRRFAGVFILASLALGHLVHPAWYLFTAFIGVNLLQSSFTNFCPLERVLGAVGFPECQRHNVRG